MKKIVVALCAMLAVAVAATTAVAQTWPDEVRQAMQQAMDDAQATLARSGIPRDQPVAILPLRGDSSGYAMGLLKNAVTGAGLTCVEGKEDPFWDEVLKEVEWDQRKDDLLDAETIARFGKLKAARILLYGTVREAAADPRRAYVEVELHASSIETKQHLWGTILAKRIYYGTSELTGIIDLDPSVRRLLAEAFDEAAARVRASEKLKGVHSVALVPLAGDIDKFVTGLAEKMLNATSLYPKQLDVLTLGEARALLRDKPQTADAVLYGAVRDLSRKLLNRHFSSTNYEINASVQLTVQSAATGEVLYSDIVDARGEDVRRLSLWEMILLYKRELIWIAIGAGALILLLIFRSATRRVR